MDIDNIISKNISSFKKNYESFIGYMNVDNKIKPLCKMVPKTDTYVKSCDGENKWMHILIDDDDILKKNIMILGIKWPIEWKQKLIANWAIKKFIETKIKPYSDEAADFHDEETPKFSSNYIHSALILLDFILKKIKTNININTLQKKKGR